MKIYAKMQKHSIAGCRQMVEESALDLDQALSHSKNAAADKLILAIVPTIRRCEAKAFCVGGKVAVGARVLFWKPSHRCIFP